MSLAIGRALSSLSSAPSLEGPGWHEGLALPHAAVFGRRCINLEGAVPPLGLAEDPKPATGRLSRQKLGLL